MCRARGDTMNRQAPGRGTPNPRGSGAPSPLGFIAMNADQPSQLETDPRFPSGPWIGYFLQKELPGKNLMELRLTFQAGNMTGEGRDRVGQFLIKGRYQLADGKCYWAKKY